VQTEARLGGNILPLAQLKRAPVLGKNFVRWENHLANEVLGFWLVSISIDKLVIRRNYPVH
jgi:hypothetical protein